MSDDLHPKLTLLPGGRDCRPLFCGVPVTLQADDHSPLEVDALACEEDRFLVLASGTEVRTPKDHPLRVINRAWNLAPLPVGSVHRREGRPVRFLAIVHDLDRTPTCRPIWILAALSALRERLLDEPRIRTLGLPLFGVRHGHLSAGESLNLLRQVMCGTRWPIDRLLLLVPRADQPEIAARLEQNQD